MADVELGYQTPPTFAGHIAPDHVRALASAPIAASTPADAVAPVVGSWSPAGGSTILAADAVAVTATDETDLATVVVRATLGAGVASEVVAVDGVLGDGYTGTVTPVAGGRTYSFSRDGGWPSASIGIAVEAVDASGNRTTASVSYTVSDPVTPPVPDVTPPVVSGWVPADASTIAAADSITVEVVDAGAGVPLANVTVWAEFGSGVAEVALVGGAFTTKYGPGSSYMLQPGGWTLLVARDGGWPDAAVTLTAQGVDSVGNVASASASYTVSDPPVADTTAPTVGSWSPSDGSTIACDNSVTVDVTDDVGVAADAVEVYAVFDDGRAEVVYANGAFALGYLGGDATLIPGGWRLRALRTASWPTAGLVLRVTGTDASGNRTTASASYTVTNPTFEGEQTEPVVASFSPPTTTSLGPSDPVFFDVVDNSGVFRAVLVWVWSGDVRESPELAHDGTDFTGRYASLSAREPTTTPAVVDAVAVEPYALVNNMTLTVLVNGIAHTLTVHTSDFVDIGAATAEEVAALLGAIDGASGGVLVDEGGQRVRFATVATGPTATIRVTGGTANAVLRFPTDLVGGGSGYHYRLRRRGGWPIAAGNVAPTITVGVKALDASGNANP